MKTEAVKVTDNAFNVNQYSKDYVPSNKCSIKSMMDLKTELKDKSHIHCHESISNMAILVYMKSKKEEN